MLGTRVLKSKELRGSRVDEALVMGTLGDVKLCTLPTIPSLLSHGRSFDTDVWLEKIRY